MFKGYVQRLRMMPIWMRIAEGIIDVSLVTLIILKLIGLNIPWWMVFIPLYVDALLVVAIVIFVAIRRKKMNKIHVMII